MKSGEGYSRKQFLEKVFLASILLPFLQYCGRKTKSFLLKITGTNHVLGHRLWAKDFPGPSEEISVKYLIVGSGISGLSAARELNLSGEKNFILLELEKNPGGNSSAGQNKFSKFPLGAHYLPLPNKEDTELIDFLRECKLYLGDDAKGKPLLDDYQLTFPQEERLFFKNSWQKNLVPQKGVSVQNSAEINRFFGMMDEFRTKKDASGNYWFDIPLKRSSAIEEARKLEEITFISWLTENNFKAEELLWLLDYSCRDDYGLGIKSVSAWAGIHYFAGRKNNWAAERQDQVFTWPEGNAKLASLLSRHSKGKISTENLVYSVKIEDKVEVLAFDAQKKVSKKIIAEKVLFSTPQFVNNYIFPSRKFPGFKYVPWLLATLTLNNEFGGDEELAWDNVIYGAEGLGYIYDQHQNINLNMGEKVITYYRSFSSGEIAKDRKLLYGLKEDQLKKLVLDDLKMAHPLIEEFLLEIEFHKLGHAMIAPVPGQIFGAESEKARENMDNKVFFAHSDLSGISIFEEAFHQGIDAAKQMMKS